MRTKQPKAYSYAYTYQQARSLGQFIRGVQVQPKPETLLAAAVLLNYLKKIANRVEFHFEGKKRFTLPVEVALAISVMCVGKTVKEYTPLELTVILPILAEVDKRLIKKPALTNEEV